MSGLNIKLADLQISDFHAPECCFLWWHTEKTFSFWGRCPQTPTRGFAPWPHWGPTAAPRPPHHFPPFSLFPSPMSENTPRLVAIRTALCGIPSLPPCLSLSLPPSLPLSLFLSLTLSPSLPPSLSRTLSLFLPLCLSLPPPSFPPSPLSLCLSVCLSVCLSLSVLIYLFMDLFV